MHDSRQFVIDNLSTKESWRLFRIMAEIVAGFEDMNDVGPAVSIFGSARSKEGDQDYEMARKLARLLSEAGYDIITGGGPGLMEAANRGAKEGGKGRSIGLHIELPHEQKSNDYLDLRVDFRYFFVRKVVFVKYAMAYIALPGGLGTLDEVIEALVLIQTKRIKPFPVILIGREFWSGMVEWFTKSLLDKGFIAPDDMELFTIMDTPEQAVSFIKRHVIV